MSRNMSKESNKEGIRKRNVKLKTNVEHQQEHKDNVKTKSKKDANDKIVYWFIGIISNILGVTFLILSSLKFAEYLEVLHENELWFSNLKEVEREISFRTEQGLYYSYFKQLINSRSFSHGIKDLKLDNSTESGRTINIISRFNIYPEITLAFLYRYFNIKNFIPAIFYYTKAIFLLNGLYVGCIYLSTWIISGSWIGGLLAVGLYTMNLQDATRVHYTVPLRESFAGPFVFAQFTCLILYLKKNNRKYRGQLSLLLKGIFTFLFTMSWQFGQFILLLQSIVLFFLHLIDILPYHQLRNLFIIDMMVMMLNFVLHHGQSMILGSLVLTFIPVVLLSTVINQAFNRVYGFMKNFTRFSSHFFGVLILTLYVNNLLKSLLNIEADDHVFKFLKSKIFFEESRDFETNLYLCNGAFNYMDWDTITRLWSHLLLPLYIPIQVFLLFSLAVSCLLKWCSVYNTSIFIIRPELSFWIVLNFLFGLLAISTLRMKMLWTPQICVIAGVGVADYTLWMVPLSKISSKTKTWMVKMVCYTGCILLIVTITLKMAPIIDSQLEDLKEFWDPDTVELMNWVKSYSPPSSVFAGSMQLLAGVKLCSNRGITNHPHFEDKWLRNRTRLVYQIYARESPENIHSILTEMKATHIILEDSICFAHSRGLCRLPDIMDISNGHLPDSIVENTPKKYLDLKRIHTPRFCDEIRHMKKTYSKYFKSVFSNKTFRVYKIL